MLENIYETLTLDGVIALIFRHFI